MAVRPVKGKTRLTAAGDILAEAGNLAWLVASNASGNVLQVVLNDATSGVTSPVMQVVVPAYDTKFLRFTPPCPFTTKIRCGLLEAGLIVTGGYV